ncbi:pentose kinase [candidate division KSB3 bacterium]|uniref:Pentose kinase n=1 Tax=candidate division KSB3 bacterium TaxID=2044937 RepID=A0A9D5Q709_9BACT|nr:pentose kinase [candidate division KSB3 bacterium]MBD3325933.1 pentose kinase [candidate division KSB3 bacterium]
MGRYIIAYDLGTGGNKASLYDQNGTCLANAFVPYETSYPHAGWHEQRPMDWWKAVVESTTQLLADTNIDRHDVVCCGISGHSLGAVPVDRDGNLLREGTPIWSDSRAVAQTQQFFEKIPETTWYETTGNGFPAPLYSVFKIMWYRDHEPAMFEKIAQVIGTKDFINYKLTGRIITDYSYASGSGVYDLLAWEYADKLIAASGLPREMFPDIVPSTEVIGTLTPEAADALGLPSTVKVVAGGVDNSCMALGARNIEEGRVYNSLGSSSWIPVCSAKPLLDVRTRPYVFTHVIPGLFTSALSIFSSGTSFQWVRDQLCQNLVAEAERRGADAYDLMTALAENSPVGANKLIFNPSLGGGTSLDASINIRGAFLGLDLGHTQADLIRAAMEGIAMGLRLALDELKTLTQLSQEILVVGGGSQSALWRQMYADVYNMRIIKTNIGQQAAALGAAAIAAVGTGLWENFEKIDDIHQIESVTTPIPEQTQKYEQLLAIFRKASQYQADLGDMFANLTV